MANTSITRKPPPDAEGARNAGPDQSAYHQQLDHESNRHDARRCLRCSGFVAWTSERRDADRSRLARLGVHQVEEAFC